MAAVRYCSCTASFVSLASQLPQWLQGLLNSTRSGTPMPGLFVVEAGGFLVIVGASLLAMAAVRYCSSTASFVSLASQLPQWLQGLLNSTRSGTPMPGLFVVEAGGFLIIVGASLLAMVAVRYCS